MRLDPAAFLRDHWQRSPLLIRDPWPHWTNPLEPDELAGLACEPGVESRLVTRTADGWTVEHGPFPEGRFARASAAPWTLLVQAVDHAVPQVAALLAAFRFIPNWRIDDVMVSYATDGGGVGPHFDNYDVFLIQGLGRRRWRLGGRCDAATLLLPHDELRLLAGFETTAEHILEPGDVLYLPPGIAHDGIAVGDDCMTYSVGFRAPSRAELVAGWSEHLAASLPDHDRYADPALPLQFNPGEIAPAALDRLYAMVTEALADRAAFARWFAAHATTPRYPDVDYGASPIPPRRLRARLAAGAPLRRNPASRFAFVRQGDSLLLAVDGRIFDCPPDTAPFAERLCAAEILRPGPISDQLLHLIRDLLAQGSLAFDEDA